MDTGWMLRKISLASVELSHLVLFPAAHPAVLVSGSRDNSVCVWDTKRGCLVDEREISRNLVRRMGDTAGMVTSHVGSCTLSHPVYRVELGRYRALCSAVEWGQDAACVGHTDVHCGPTASTKTAHSSEHHILSACCCFVVVFATCCCLVLSLLLSVNPFMQVIKKKLKFWK